MIPFLKAYDSSKAYEIPVRLTKADELWVEFEEVQLEIEELRGDDSAEEQKERGAFYSAFFDIVGRLNELKTPANRVTQVQASAAAAKPEIRLPTMEIPTFHGSYKHWCEFLDTFNSLVDANRNLTDIQRFYYLKGALKGSAADVIHSLEVSSANYKVAWDLLRERFENKKVIALSHIESMCSFPNMCKESHTDLRKFVDGIRRNLRALRTLGLGVDHWDPLLIYILEGKLDPVTRKEWQRQSAVDSFASIDQFLKCLANKCSLLETHFGKGGLSEHTDRSKPQTRSVPHTTLKSYSAQRESRCTVCKSPDHYLQSCRTFIDMAVQGKRDVIGKAGLCWNCLRPGHRVQACTSGSCKYCKGKHHSLLHIEQGGGVKENKSNRQGLEVGKDTSNEGNSNKDRVNLSFYGHKSTEANRRLQNKEGEASEVILSTAIIKVQDQQGKLHECRALLDCGSQSSFMTRSLRDKLQLPMKQTNISILGIGPGVTNVTQRVNTRISSVHTDYMVESGFLIIDKISSAIPSININISLLGIPNDLVLADNSFGTVGAVDVLLGASIFWDVLGTEKIELGKGKPMIRGTKLGYVIAGNLGNGFDTDLRPVQGCNLVSKVSVQEQLERFWVLEEVGYERPRTREEEDCERFFVDTTKKDKEGRFIVKLPFRLGTPDLGDSLKAAVKRFISMERKLERDSELRELYHAFVQEYIDLGHMSEVEAIVSEQQTTTGVYYLPHHPVLKKASLTTKLRVVFDASAVTTSGVSLNDRLMVGPKLQDDVFNILLRFRLHSVVITADVEKIFRQVWVAEEDRDFQRVLWRFDVNEPIGHYRLNTVTYGMAWSGYLAVKCMQQLAEGVSKDSEAAKVAVKDFYMDDLLTGAGSIEDARFLKEEISELLAAGGFILRKWKSNRPEVILSNGEANVEHYIISSDSDISKTLGIRWNAQFDILSYDCPADYENLIGEVTKRQILSLIAQLFDPLGLIDPLVIRAKLVLQTLWKARLGWDDKVPEEVLLPWLGIQKEFGKLKEIQINRHVIFDGAKEIQLHGFCDASQKAYGACVFVSSVTSEGICHTHLLCSKSRVAPLKVISLPRLELCGALLLAKLMQSVLQSTELKPSEVRYWSDSSIVLCWLAREPSTWTTFVANRTAEVQHLTQGHKWGHVPSEENPADLVSRGVDSDNLKVNSLWWNGPWWLARGKQYWPQEEGVLVDIIPDQRKVRQVFAVVNFSYIFQKFSSFSRLQRVMAYCGRFSNNSRVSREKWQVGSLTVDELDGAWVVIMKMVQGEDFVKELKSISKGDTVDNSSKLVSLNPFIDSQGLLRVGGRLGKADIGYDQRFPVILPAKHRVTRLIVLQEHYRHLHAGPQALLAQLRLKYWPINGRHTIRSVLRSCIVCFRVKPRDLRQHMGELPRARVTPSRPFANCGVDYAGPFSIKANRGRGFVAVKAYLCVFVCFATRAVHLELMADLSTQAFLNCFKRFISHRGICNNIYSDNATNFTGANNELRTLYQFLQNETSQKAFAEYFAGSSIRWHFIPPRSPHFGGLWESAVKSAKYHLKRVIGEQKLTFEELYTIITQVECCMNSRPLTPLSEAPEDLEVLTPSHFLIGGSPFTLPQEDLMNYNPNRLQRYHLLTQLIQGFWKRWQLEYLCQLQQRHKWRGIEDNIKLGDMVIVREENLPPMKWQLGRIIELHPGTDNKCRVVSIKTSNGVLKRATSRVCVLPIEDSSSA